MSLLHVYPPSTTTYTIAFFPPSRGMKPDAKVSFPIGSRGRREGRYKTQRKYYRRYFLTRGDVQIRVD
jgi:hypothetical protein